jgi:Protein of unknown function (DUF3500)
MAVLKYPRVVLGLVLGAVLFVATVTASQRQASAMASAANAFLAGLSPEQREQAALPFEGEERMRWNFIPNEMFPRKGLMVKSMSEAQRAQAHALLKSGLSQKGYMTATAIMELEDVLRAIEATGGGDSRGGPPRFARHPLEYYFTIFGTPSAKGAWGWRVDGHHVSLHFTIQDGKAVASTPTFFGSNPAHVLDGPKKGLSVLAPEEDAGRALVQALDDAQRKTATILEVAPNDIATGNKPSADPQTPVGIMASAMTPPQRELLMKLIDVYASYMAEDSAAERLSKLKTAGVEKIAFAWAGGIQPGEKHYYRVQGPTFLIEFDDTQNNGNHIHSVWRDFKGDFGRDLLTEHLAAFPH